MERVEKQMEGHIYLGAKRGSVNRNYGQLKIYTWYILFVVESMLAD